MNLMKVGDRSEVKSKRQEKALMKQKDCIVSDSTGSCQIVLWQNDVGKLEEGCCYKLLNIMLVRHYAGVKYLSMSEYGVVNQVADIDEEVSDNEDFNDQEVEG